MLSSLKIASESFLVSSVIRGLGNVMVNPVDSFLRISAWCLGVGWGFQGLAE
jgi:hypothetical protein